MCLPCSTCTCIQCACILYMYVICKRQSLYILESLFSFPNAPGCPFFQWFINNKSLLCVILCCNIVAYGMLEMQSTTYVDEVFGSSVTCQEVRGHLQYTPHIHVDTVYCTCTVVVHEV